MSERHIDLEAVARDDQLLDALGAGLAPNTTDPAIRALYAWRRELAAGVDDVPTSAPRSGSVRPATSGPLRDSAPRNGAVRPHLAASGAPAGRKRPPRRDQDLTPVAERPRRGRRRAAAAAAFVGLSAGLGGVTVAAADAEPGSPLWPITKVVYSEAAEHRQAEANAKIALAKARKALAEGRVDEAERYLDEAGRYAGGADPDKAKKLREKLDAVREEIDESGGDKSANRPSPTDNPEDPLPDPSLPSPSPSEEDPSPTPGDGDTTESGDTEPEKGKGKGKGKGKDGRKDPDDPDSDDTLQSSSSVGPASPSLESSPLVAG